MKKTLLQEMLRDGLYSLKLVGSPGVNHRDFKHWNMEDSSALSSYFSGSNKPSLGEMLESKSQPADMFALVTDLQHELARNAPPIYGSNCHTKILTFSGLCFLESEVIKVRWSLRGTTSLVTGGTRGIGRAIVEELVGFGAKVHTCSRNETELNDCLENWVGSGFEVTGSVCDASVRAQREQLIGTLSSLFDNKLDILISRQRNCPLSWRQILNQFSTCAN
ncbi:hypothetical protein LWI28_012913 [Acer negundo]|uniref:Uncharacterized protein n=1 Tax=Acer negundo TaxID=4023 RepID=A0AAD5JL60_ACENE|nr:hypothetical protein LWI28_012913 [Acer negundo]